MKTTWADRRQTCSRTLAAYLIAVALVPLLPAGIEEDNWYKVSVSAEGERVDVGHMHGVVTSVEARAGKVWEARSVLVVVVPAEKGGPPSRMQITTVETSDDAGHILSQNTETKVNGNVELREFFRVDGAKLTYEITDLETGKRTGTHTMPGRPMSYRVIIPQLLKEKGKTGDTLAVIELPSADTVENPDFTAEYRNEGVTTVEVKGKPIRLRKFSFKGGWLGDLYLDIDGNMQMMVMTVEGMLLTLTRTTEEDAKILWQDQQEDAEVQVRVVDALNLLISFYSVLETSMRFDYIDSAIINNVRHDQFPPELEDILKRLMHLCEQGRIALDSEGLVHDEHARKANSIAIRCGAKVGAALAMEDPVGLLFAVVGGFHDAQRADDGRTRKVRAIYQQFEHRMKVDKYELSVLRDKLQKQYEIPDGYIVSFEALGEIRAASLVNDPEARIRRLSLLAEKHPAYGPLRLAIATSMFHGMAEVNTQQFGACMDVACESRNAVLKVDPTAVNALQFLGSFVMLNAWVEPKTYGDLTKAGEALTSVAQAGLELDPTIPEFYLFQGVADIMKSPVRVSDDSWNLIIKGQDVQDETIQQLRCLWALAYAGGRDDVWSDNKYKAVIDALFRLGFADGASLRRSAGLKRTAARDRILRQKLTPAWDWSVTDDLWWDDVKLTNKSPFALTDVVLTVTLRKGKAEKTLKLTSNHLASGGTKTWEDVVDGVSGTWDDASRANLSCGQTSWACD
jgi:hypothetical protein